MNVNELKKPAWYMIDIFMLININCALNVQLKSLYVSKIENLVIAKMQRSDTTSAIVQVSLVQLKLDND